MKDPISKYFQVGTIQWMSHPPDQDSVLDSIKKILCDDFFDAIEVTRFADPETRAVAKKMLEKISGEKLVGYRAPNALVGGWMVDSLEKLGFKYDSSVSVNSFYNKTDSALNTVSSFPYYPVKNDLEAGSDRNFIEFPWAYCQHGFKFPASGGPMLRFLGSSLVEHSLYPTLQ